MAVKDQIVNDRYALFNGDCIEVMRDFPTASVGLSAPPTGAAGVAVSLGWAVTPPSGAGTLTPSIVTLL